MAEDEKKTVTVPDWHWGFQPELDKPNASPARKERLSELAEAFQISTCKELVNYIRQCERELEKHPTIETYHKVIRRLYNYTRQRGGGTDVSKT